MNSTTTHNKITRQKLTFKITAITTVLVGLLLAVMSVAAINSDRFENEAISASQCMECSSFNDENLPHAGTPVLMAAGYTKQIESIRPGDMVKSYNQVTGKIENKRVLQTFENETNEITKITTSDGDVISSTPGHKFYANNKWVSAQDLRAGDILVSVNGEKVIVEQVKHEILENPIKVYNFEVQDNNTYLVGKENGVVVHNSVCNSTKGSSVNINSTKNTVPKFNYTDKVNGQMLQDKFHGFPTLIDDIAATSGKCGKFVGDDGLTYICVELPGEICVNNKWYSGVYQWFIDMNGSCNHRLFETNIDKWKLFLPKDLL